STKNLSASLPAGFTSQYSNYLVLIGAVPSKTLQLPDEFMLDGWGNRIDYAVTAAFAGYQGDYDNPNSGGTSYHIRNTNMGLITIQDAALSVRTNQAVYALISHGANQLGAWRKTGAIQTNSPTNTNELRNVYAAGNIAGNLAFVQQEALPSELAPYDDIVRYQMKWQIIRNAGGVVSEVGCAYVDRIITSEDIQVGLNYYSGICGVTPGDSGCALYINSIANQLLHSCL
ncbi:MAG: hypothetical protein ACK4M7_10945, partial [Burkholderiales bacterium]